MKCPKCQYVGFEEAGRCRHCGYDFSLATPAPLDAPVLGAAAGLEGALLDRAGQAPPGWDVLRATPAAPPEPIAALAASPAAPPDVPPDAPLPLFAVGEDDQPLVRLPAVPRRPVAVRRTPEIHRLRAVPKPLGEVPSRDLLFDPGDDSATDDADTHGATGTGRAPAVTSRAASAGARLAAAEVVSDETHESVPLVARAAAVLIDHGLLGAIDLAVVYFTLRMAGLTMDDWRMLPIVPFGLFLLLLGFSYFGLFTTFGGQTIGKMLLGIRVVPDPYGLLDHARALRRTSAALVSVVTCGLAYLPAGFGDRRTLHDRVAGTRVVRRRSS